MVGCLKKDSREDLSSWTNFIPTMIKAIRLTNINHFHTNSPPTLAGIYSVLSECGNEVGNVGTPIIIIIKTESAQETHPCGPSRFRPARPLTTYVSGDYNTPIQYIMRYTTHVAWLQTHIYRMKRRIVYTANINACTCVRREARPPLVQILNGSPGWVMDRIWGCRVDGWMDIWQRVLFTTIYFICWWFILCGTNDPSDQWQPRQSLNSNLSPHTATSDSPNVRGV